jgi:valyl-tRNA synthetase
MAVLQDLIVNVRNLRAELEVEAKQRVPIEIFTEDTGVRSLIEQNRTALERLANVEEVRFVTKSLSKLQSARHTARFDVRLIYEKQIDVAAERAKLTKELEKLGKEKSDKERQLANEQFVAKAPAHVVEKIRARVEELKVLIEKIRRKLGELG